MFHSYRNMYLPMYLFTPIHLFSIYLQNSGIHINQVLPTISAKFLISHDFIFLSRTTIPCISSLQARFYMLPEFFPAKRELILRNTVHLLNFLFNILHRLYCRVFLFCFFLLLPEKTLSYCTPGFFYMISQSPISVYLLHDNFTTQRLKTKNKTFH